jgi:hypothetical protein
MLLRLCEDVGLTVESIEATGGSPAIVLDIVEKHLGRWHLLAAVHALVSIWVDGRSTLAAASRYTAPWFLQGYVLVATKWPES